jgi:hypothetical protein
LPRDGGLRPKNEGTKMPRNIIIFSDGTGQVGGLRPDERRSNIYKLYRATRCGPDTDIDPATQVTFYDAGLGSMPPEGTFFVVRAYRWLHNLFSLATGLGITTNIIDCYCAILSMWEPGDRVFVFGFSRGAYTVRCLAAVLSMCGVPTTMADGKTPLRRDAKSIKKIANEAVKNVYQHVSSPADEKYVGQRKAIALRFRRKYNSDVGDIPNVNTSSAYSTPSHRSEATGCRRPWWPALRRSCCSEAGPCLCSRWRSGRGCWCWEGLPSPSTAFGMSFPTCAMPLASKATHFWKPCTSPRRR